MRGSEIVGGVAVAGLVVMVALSLANDEQSTVRTAPATGSAEGVDVGDAGTPNSTSAPVSAASTAPSASTTTTTVSSSGGSTTSSTALPEAMTTAPPTETAPPPPSTTPPPTTLAVEERAAIRVRALNGGAGRGAGGGATDVLEEAGFEPLSPADAWQHIDVPGRILFRPGADLAAVTMAHVLGYSLEHIAEGHEDDDNWRHFSDDVDVLVIVGPS